jgi:hypothetical protein
MLLNLLKKYNICHDLIVIMIHKIIIKVEKLYSYRISRNII